VSNADYLWTVARGLRTQVRPHVGDDAACETLDNGIRVLTAVANALEPGPPELPASATNGSDEAGADTDRLSGPPDNPAAYRNTAPAIARIACAIREGAKGDAPREGIAWEKGLLDAAIGRMDAVERAAPEGEADDGSAISPERLQAYLRQWAGAEDVTITAFRAVPGGRSRQTALLSVTGGGLPGDMVIQRAFPGLAPNGIFLGERAQHDLLARLHEAGLRVPRPVLVETDPAPLDAPFLLVERAPGKPVQPDYWLPAENEAVVLDLAREMALLHRQPIDRLGRDLRAPGAARTTATWRAEMEDLAAKWNGMALWPSITMSAALEWMRANVDCLDDRQCVIHNDMVFHNILAQGDHITAVLDWEQCAIGHPGEDLGYCYPAVIAVTEWSRFMDIYREAGGADVPQRQIDYFALRGCIRLMYLVLIGGRDSFQKGGGEGILLASAGAHFTQRLLHRITVILASILERNR